jgi:predicted RNA-binding Zn ribbon-like protein
MVSSRIQDSAVEPEVDLLVGFVNTLDLEEGTDAVATPAELSAWIEEKLGSEFAGEVGEEGHASALALRESLRALLHANNGGEAPRDPELAALRAAASRARYEPACAIDGYVDLEPSGSGTDALEARLLLALERVQTLGVWPRVKACPAGECQWAFFDETRNRSRTWCSMEECGNREKTRRYRERHSRS